MVRSATFTDSRWVGRILRDKWKIDRRIARGGMGTVFAATHRNNGSSAAIKVLHPEFNRDNDTRSRFLQEGYAANKVNHPGVVRILDDDVTEEGLAFLVMELLEGELLEQRRIRKGGKLPLVEVYEFADQLLDVLSAAHAQGIVHRDVKPDNIFLTREGRLKVLDFGFAQMKSGFRQEQTATGFLLGTPGFMAPEQAVGNRPLIDAQTDIWAVGATLFQLLSGQPVHAADSAAEMLIAAASFPARSITTLEPRLPTKLSHIVDRALAFAKQDRWPDAKSMQSALRAVPGRQATTEPIRRSLVDEGERVSAAPAALVERHSPASAVTRAPRVRGPSAPTPHTLEDSTMMDDVEELNPEELHTGETPAYPRRSPHARKGHEDDHPSDRDGPTLAFDRDSEFAGHRGDGEGPTVALGRHGGGLPALPSEHERPDETVIMDVRPVHAPGGAPGGPPRPNADLSRAQDWSPPSQRPHQNQNLTPPQPLAAYPQQPYPQQQQQQQLPPSDLRYSTPDALSTSDRFNASQPYPALPVPTAAPTGSRVLVFILVAGITMVIVIFTGLIIILAND